MKPRDSSGLLDRRVQQRDARLFVIAIEGERAGEEYAYFTDLESLDLLDRRRVKLVLLPADPTAHDSAPEQVLARLDRHAAAYRLRAIDQRWLVLDRDRWQERTLSTVCQTAHQQGVGVALSNPCFEVWVLLHTDCDLGLLDAVEPKLRPRATKLQLGALRAAGQRCAPTRETLWKARHAAAALNLEPTTRWPETTGSRVYLLVDALAEAGALPR